MTTEHHPTSVHRDQPFEQGIGYFLLMVVFGLCLSAALALSNVLYGNVPWSAHISGYLLIAASLAFFAFVSDRIWKSTTEPLVRNFHPLAVFGSRLPFWYFGGGIGYVIGLLLAKKAGLMTVYDIPVKSIFTFGGFGVMVLRIPFQRWSIFLNRRP
ncbi:MAG TPA: hypothetical protein VLY03_07615 [Bacteroidota bacterium]|nr:hypothetical protein [Bacteroidota bacterium]